jgi:phosphoglycerate kinase
LESRARGIDLLGLKLDDPKGDIGSGAPLDGMSSTRDPILLEACIRFMASSSAELLPSAGPVKVKNAGYGDNAGDDQAEALEKALGQPVKPVAAVVGGAKVSTKLDVLKHLVTRVDHLIIGGGMANTFLAARGVDVGKSLCEHDLAATAEAILEAADAAGCTVHLPYDVVVATEFAANPASLRTCNVHEVADDEMILDIGPQAVEALGDALKTCRTLVWNGPLGAFEIPPFDTATVALARTAAALSKEGELISVAGGGDTVAALHHAGVADDFTYVSTAGGAFLEWMEGRELPGVKALEV